MSGVLDTCKAKIILSRILRFQPFIATIVTNTPAKPMLIDSSFSMLKLSGFSFFYAPKNTKPNIIKVLLR